MVFFFNVLDFIIYSNLLCILQLFIFLLLIVGVLYMFLIQIFYKKHILNIFSQFV